MLTAYHTDGGHERTGSSLLLRKPLKLFIVSLLLLTTTWIPTVRTNAIRDDDIFDGLSTRHDDHANKDQDTRTNNILAELQDDPEVTALGDLPKNGDLFEGDMVMDNRLRRAVWGLKEKKSAMAGLEKAGLLWPNGVIPYEIDPDFPPEQRARLARIQTEFHHRTCIRFHPRRSGERNYVYYTSWKDECSSNIGMSGGRQNITLGPDCSIDGTYEHENMHALGFIHEHSRPDRDDYLDVKYKNIKKSEWVNFQKYSMDQVQNFDTLNFASIMLYRNDAFTKNGQDTLESLDQPGLKFGQRVKFSAGDIKEINKLYKCTWYLNHPDYHGLYKEYHTRRRKKKKDVDKEEVLKDLLKRMLPLIRRLREREEQEVARRRRDEQ